MRFCNSGLSIFVVLGPYACLFRENTPQLFNLGFYLNVIISEKSGEKNTKTKQKKKQKH